MIKGWRKNPNWVIYYEARAAERACARYRAQQLVHAQTALTVMGRIAGGNLSHVLERDEDHIVVGNTH